MLVFGKRKAVVWICLLLLLIPCSSVFAADPSGLSKESESELDAYVQHQIDTAGIPGVSVIIVKGDKAVYQKGFGYADLASKTSITPQTLFELGSTTKAFTALAVLKLVDSGLLNLNDQVEKYLPWFEAKAAGRKAGITINQLLRHTSGIPTQTIGIIPEGSDDQALERTVKLLSGVNLAHDPGKGFTYSTLNYSVAALIVETVTGKTFEEYMKSEVLQPLGLSHTYLFRQEAEAAGAMATGYKLGFSKPRAYKEPVFRGNTPGGYVISNAEDIGTWLRIQLGLASTGSFPSKLIKQSQAAEPGGFYGMGWYVEPDGNRVHFGANPSFSSFFMLLPSGQTGVAILGNINSDAMELIGRGIVSVMDGKKPVDQLPIPNAFNQVIERVDKQAYTTLIIAIPLLAGILVLYALSIRQVYQRKRLRIASKVKRVIGIAGTLGFLVLVGWGLYFTFWNVKFMGFPLSFVLVWGPKSFLPAVFAATSVVVLSSIYFLITFLFPKADDKPYFLLVFLSLISGFGNASVIFVISMALTSGGVQFRPGLLAAFITGVLVYVFGQRMVRAKLIRFTSGVVFERRIQLIHILSRSSFQKLEPIHKGRIHAVLNNDTEAVSRFAGTIVGLVTNSITLTIFFVYLAIVNFYGFLLSLSVVVIAAVLYFMIGRHARKQWERNRDIQNSFFKFIGDLIGGFKELYLNRQKQDSFREDMIRSCDEYRLTRIKGDLRFTYAGIFGELLFVFVIGSVTFAFPVLFQNISQDNLRNFVFGFLYMTGPVNGILGAIPAFFSFRISWNRINETLAEIGGTQLPPSPGSGAAYTRKVTGNIVLELKDVMFQYSNENGGTFAVGPINETFRSGEIVFVTGGNGSGKSTLGKLITGLYVPESGTISINGEKINSEDLGAYYSTIFSDFYLFESLYGIDTEAQKETIDFWLKRLQIDEKVRVENGKFSTLQLSAGQRKRLALLLSYLENQPICMFDEWAADQDPEFRRFFYHSLLPELKEQGKCVIAITHDDGYFHTADRMMKMEMGRIVDHSNQPQAIQAG